MFRILNGGGWGLSRPFSPFRALHVRSEVAERLEVLALRAGGREGRPGRAARFGPREPERPMLERLAVVGGAQRVGTGEVPALVRVGLQVVELLLPRARVVDELVALVAQRVARAVPHGPGEDGRP